MVSKKLDMANDPTYSDRKFKKVFERIDNLLFGDEAKYIKNRPMTIQEIAIARKNLDKSLNKISSGDSDVAKLLKETDEGTGDIIRAYRDSLNEVVDGLAATKGVDTSALRRRQSNLLAARENFSKADAALNEKTKSQKVISYAMNHPFTIAAGLTGGGVMYNPALLTAGAVGLGGYGVLKAAASPLTRIGAGGMLQSQLPTAAAAASLYGGAPDEGEQQIQQLLNRQEGDIMPKGKGTYGSKVGRPTKKKTKSCKKNKK